MQSLYPAGPACGGPTIGSLLLLPAADPLAAVSAAFEPAGASLPCVSEFPGLVEAGLEPVLVLVAWLEGVPSDLPEGAEGEGALGSGRAGVGASWGGGLLLRASD